jgi:hypothetical protein
MPAVSPEAIANKKRLRNERDRASRKIKRVQIMKSDLPIFKISARRMLPRLPENMSKAELREMLAQAAANTVTE